jgi:hypothetical protein
MTQSNIVMVPFCAEDLLYVEPRDEQKNDIFVALGEAFTRQVGTLLEQACAKTNDGRLLSCTIMDEDKILGCAGIYENFKGSGEAWAIFSKDIGRYKYTLLREIRSHIKDYDYTRLQSCARADFKEAQKFLQSCGLKREAKLRKATVDGKDLLIFSMVR